MSERYFLKADFNQDWAEVTLAAFCKAERMAGFRPKMASDDPRYMFTPATGGFSGNGVSGKVVYESTPERADSTA